MYYAANTMVKSWRGGGHVHSLAEALMTLFVVERTVGRILVSKISAMEPVSNMLSSVIGWNMIELYAVRGKSKLQTHSRGCITGKKYVREAGGREKKAGSSREPKQPGTHYPEHPAGPLRTTTLPHLQFSWCHTTANSYALQHNGTQTCSDSQR